MEYQKLTDEMMAAARDYVPLMEKMAFVRACAADCFDRMELRLTDETVLPFFKENGERKSRYLMGALVKLYLMQKIEPAEATEFLLAADDYDRWAGGHILGQLSRMKSKGGDIGGKANDLLSDYKELEKRFNAETYALLQGMNDPVSRMQQMAMQSMTPEAVQRLAERSGEIKDELDALRKKRERK